MHTLDRSGKEGDTFLKCPPRRSNKTVPKNAIFYSRQWSKLHLPFLRRAAVRLCNIHSCWSFCQSLGTCRLRMQSTGPWGAHINLLHGVDDVKQVPLCQVTMETELSLAQPIFSVEYLSFSSFRSRDLLSGDKLRLCTSTQPYVSFSEICKLVWKQLLLCWQLRHCRMRGRCAAPWHRGTAP